MGFFEKFSFDRFLASLQYMWQGMLCIFIVIGVIILTTILMNSICVKLDEKKKKKEENQQS